MSPHFSFARSCVVHPLRNIDIKMKISADKRLILIRYNVVF